MSEPLTFDDELLGPAISYPPNLDIQYDHCYSRQVERRDRCDHCRYEVAEKGDEASLGHSSCNQMRVIRIQVWPDDDRRSPGDEGNQPENRNGHEDSSGCALWTVTEGSGYTEVPVQGNSQKMQCRGSGYRIVQREVEFTESFSENPSLALE